MPIITLAIPEKLQPSKALCFTLDATHDDPFSSWVEVESIPLAPMFATGLAKYRLTPIIRSELAKPQVVNAIKFFSGQVKVFARPDSGKDGKDGQMASYVKDAGHSEYLEEAAKKIGEVWPSVLEQMSRHLESDMPVAFRFRGSLIHEHPDFRRIMSIQDGVKASKPGTCIIPGCNAGRVIFKNPLMGPLGGYWSANLNIVGTGKEKWWEEGNTSTGLCPECYAERLEGAKKHHVSVQMGKDISIVIMKTSCMEDADDDLVDEELEITQIALAADTPQQVRDALLRHDSMKERRLSTTGVMESNTVVIVAKKNNTQLGTISLDYCNSMVLCQKVMEFHKRFKGHPMKRLMKAALGEDRKVASADTSRWVNRLIRGSTLTGQEMCQIAELLVKDYLTSSLAGDHPLRLLLLEDYMVQFEQVSQSVAFKVGETAAVATFAVMGDKKFEKDMRSLLRPMVSDPWGTMNRICQMLVIQSTAGKVHPLRMAEFDECRAGLVDCPQRLTKFDEFCMLSGYATKSAEIRSNFGKKKLPEKKDVPDGESPDSLSAESVETVETTNSEEVVA